MATVNNSQRIVDSLVNIVRNAVQTNSVDGDDSADFVSVLRATRASLRRRSKSAPARRGPKRKSTWNVSTFLLRRANADFLPRKEEADYLSQNGFGLSGTKIAVMRELPLENVEDEVINQYPRVSLGRSGFLFARADKGRRLENFSGSSVDELEQFVGKGKLIIIPRRDLLLPSPVHRQEMEWVEAGTPSISFRQTQATQAVVVGDGDVISNAASAVSTSTAASGGSTSSTSTAPLLFVNHSQAPTPSDVLQQGGGNHEHQHGGDNAAIIDLREGGGNHEHQHGGDNAAIIDLREAFSGLSALLGTTSSSDVHHISIHRDNMMAEMFDVYSSHPNVVSQQVRVSFVGEEGDDFGGLTKDLYTSLWGEIFREYFQGEAALVPSIPVYKFAAQRRNFITIGRILTHTIALLQIMPARLSQTTLICLAFGPEQVSEDLLLQDFRLFLNSMDRALVDRALEDFSKLSSGDYDTLLSIFQLYGMYSLPTARNLKDQLVNTARHCLVDIPGPFVDLMKSGIPQAHIDIFWSALTMPAIESMFEQQLPSGDKLLAVLAPEDDNLRQDQQNAFYFLQQYVRQLDQDELMRFLQFVTGASVMPDRVIVTFNALSGELRRPIAHTCSNTLELSCTYICYQELKRELNLVLQNPLSFSMSMF